ncbi:hypothetical protein BN946_scf184392.g6 [Trametes cinnabarina]|uniref:Uncharacterized protein n=1 Tax=Pycnoporus cinnabarinus TaxID=5643 RepID=A0A060SJ32_PYCCI|nr:hypothetical protein BN946_scf184392.g6 [Trametes cinnabarina]
MPWARTLLSPKIISWLASASDAPVTGTADIQGDNRDLETAAPRSSTIRRAGIAGIPAAANVQMILHGSGGRFFAKGGCVEHAMDFVVGCAMAQSPFGDEIWDEFEEQCAQEGDTDSIAYVALHKCDNNLQFIRVAERLSLGDPNRYRASTPYAGRGAKRDEEEDVEDVDDVEDDEGMDEDDEGDEDEDVDEDAEMVEDDDEA